MDNCKYINKHDKISCNNCHIGGFCDEVDTVDCYFKQLRTATEQLSIAREALSISVKNIDNCRQSRDCTKCYIANFCSFYKCQQALAKIEEIKC